MLNPSRFSLRFDGRFICTFLVKYDTIKENIIEQ